MGDFWTFKQLARVGVMAGLAALVLWPVFAIAQGLVRAPFIAALALAALSGISILFITVKDLLTVTRARSMLPARIFDLAFGAALTLPSGLALITLLG